MGETLVQDHSLERNAMQDKIDKGLTYSIRVGTPGPQPRITIIRICVCVCIHPRIGASASLFAVSFAHPRPHPYQGIVIAPPISSHGGSALDIMATA